MATFTPYAVVQQPSLKDLTYRGLAAALGGPVDLATMVMRPFGYVTPDKRVVGGSEWIGKRMEDAGLVSTARAPWQELAASMVSPSGAAKGAAVGLGKLGALGMTAWHGSPHKFDKFDLSKVNTGEGTQAQGHGAYLAELESVGREYRHQLSQHLSRRDGETPGYLYKTDIPDEAVAQMLDWDKPLSKQAPAVQAVLRQDPYIDQLFKSGTIDDVYWNGGDFYKEMTAAKRFNNSVLEKSNRAAQAEVSADLLHRGIPGIRYFDGISRKSGVGTSNFAIFDPDLIRILERNGAATGAKPWMPGEYKLPSK